MTGALGTRRFSATDEDECDGAASAKLSLSFSTT
jgi:hypothetical protein